MTLTANANVDRLVDQELREYPVAAAVHIFHEAIVGLNPAGLLKPFVPGDEFAGIAYEEVDNSSGAAAAKKCRVWTVGDFVLPLSGAANKHAGLAVYAMADDAIALTGHPLAFMGRIVHKDADASNYVVVRMKKPGERPRATGDGSITVESDFSDYFAPTGAAGAGAVFQGPDGFRLSSALGLGVAIVDAGGAADLEFDAVAEIAHASIETLQQFAVSKGARMDVSLHLPDIGTAALDFDFGFVSAITANSRASMDHADATDLALFHMDAASADILAQSDDGTTDVAPVDTTIDNVTTAGAYKDFTIIIRPGGAVEFWADGVRLLSTTVFAVAAAAVLAATINLEKTSDASTGKVRVRKCTVTGAAA